MYKQFNASHVSDSSHPAYIFALIRVAPQTLPSLPYPGDGRHQQRLDPDARIVDLLLREPGVDHINDPVDGQRGLCNVGRDDDLAPSGASFPRGWGCLRGE